MANSTAIIPVKIDSQQREKNINCSINYLLKHTDFKIIITEADEEQKLNLSFNPRIEYIFEKSPTTEFHRTRILNQMLSITETPVVVNYDADVLLPPEAYKISEDLILNKDFDLVYPYGFEQFDQIRVIPNLTLLEKFYKSLDINDIPQDCVFPGFCRFGHVQFFKTNSYKKGFMENENYKHWCAEDEERGIRFQKLGFKVVWFRSPILHQEHPPSFLKEPDNKQEIDSLHKLLISSSKEELLEYYSKQEYIKKYN